MTTAATTIKLADDLFPTLRAGEKRITIRKGLRSYTLGPAVIESTSGALEPVAVTIVRLTFCLAGDVTQFEAGADGFESVAAFMRGMRRFYPDLDLTDPVTIVHFEPEAA